MKKQAAFVSLERIVERDLPQLFSWRNDRRIYEWCRQTSPLHWEAHLSWYKKQSEDPKISMFKILDDFKTLVGVCGLTDIDLTHRRAEFSCYIGPEHWGYGLSRLALKSLFMHGFKDLGLNRIWGETFEGNRALSIFTKELGMEIEGIRREFYYHAGHFINAHLVSVNASKFLGLFDDEIPQTERAAKAADLWP